MASKQRKKKMSSTALSRRAEYIYNEKVKALRDAGLPINAENMDKVTIYTYWEVLK